MTAVATRRTAIGFLLAALVLATVPRCPRNWETWDRDAAPVPAAQYHAPAPLGPGARHLREQILDQRGGVR